MGTDYYSPAPYKRKRHSLHPKTVDRVHTVLSQLQPHFTRFDEWEIDFYTTLFSMYSKYGYALWLSDSQLEWLHNMERKYIPKD